MQVGVKANMKTRFLLLINVFLIAMTIFSSFKIFAGNTTSINPPKEAERMAFLCLNNNHKQICYEEQLSQLLAQKGVLATQETLNALQEVDQDSRSCHALAHKIARLAVRQNPSDWKNLLSKVNPNMCGGGFMHGIIEAHTGDDPSFTISATTINEICRAESPFWFSQCIHTFGHIALLQTEGDVPSALPICDSLPKDDSSECFNGLFMEDSFKNNLLEHGFVKSASDPSKDKKRFNEVFKRCIQYGGSTGIGCWSDLGPIFDEYYKYDYQKVYDACQKADEEVERKSCYFKAIGYLVIYPEINTAERLLPICSPYLLQDKNTYKRCTIYLSASFVYNSPNFTAHANTFCSTLSSEYQEDCFKAIGEILKESVTSIDQRETLCRPVDDRFKDLCLNGNQDKSIRFSPFGIL